MMINAPIDAIAGIKNLSWSASLLAERATRVDPAALSEESNRLVSEMGRGKTALGIVVAFLEMTGKPSTW